MNKFKISIIIPVFNRETIIISCLDSIFNQSLSQDLFEVIIVDDCSTDNSVDKIKKYSKIKNIKIIELDKNSGGASKPRNIGIENAQGDYLLFIDSDDTITKDALSLSLDIATSQNVDMVVIPILFGPNRNSYTKLFDDYPDGIKKEYFSKNKNLNQIVFSNPGIIGRLYKTSILKESGIRFSEKLRIYEDTLFSRFVFSIFESFGMVAKDLAHYAPSPAANEENLSLLKRTIERCVTYITEAIRICNETPNSIISEKKKIRIINNTLCRNNIFNTINNKAGYFALAPHLSLLLPYLYQDEIREKAKNLIRMVSRTVTMQENINLAEAHFKSSLNFNHSDIHITRIWIWKEQTLVIDFNIKNNLFGFDIHQENEGLQLVSLVLREDTKNLPINWSDYGKTIDNHIHLFHHSTAHGLQTALNKISYVAEDIMKKINQ